MNFGFGQPQNQPQQPFQMNQQPQQFNQVDFMRQQQEANVRYHMNSLKQPLEKLFQLQNQQEFQHLIQILTSQLKNAKEQLQKAVDKSDVKPIEAPQMEELFKRGQKIRQRNSVLLQKVLLVKAKLERSLYPNINPNSRYEYETSVTMDKIRSLKSEITQKCAYLKTLKVNKPIENEERRIESKSANFSNIGTALTELKKGAEVLEREVLKQKTEMEYVTKYVNERS